MSRAWAILLLAILTVPAATALPTLQTGEGMQATTDDARIQPGVALVTPFTTCTGGFVFTDPAGTFYVATAGHCFGDLVQCESLAGIRVRVDGLGEIGTKVLCYDRGVGTDLALVRIDHDKADRVDPAMMAWGGPTAPEGPTMGIVRHYGHGLVYGETEETRARTGFGTTRDDHAFRMMGLVVNGDSGSPVRSDDGHAIGILTHANGNLGVVAHSAPYAYGTTVERILDVASARGFDLTLVTAPIP